MDTKEAQEMIRQIYLKRDQERGMSRTVLRTFEELAELSEAIMREKGREAIAEEIADVFAWLCSIANLLDIDISEALLKKYNKVCSKCEKSPCECVNTP